MLTRIRDRAQDLPQQKLQGEQSPLTIGKSAMSAETTAFLTAEWRHLAMLNYEVDPQILRRHVPRGTELDLWNDRAYVSIVGFRFLNTALMGLPIPFHGHFTEVNLRFYVRRRVQDEWRRGVVFVKEIVPLPTVTLVARWVYNENYVTLGMRHKIELPQVSNGGCGMAAYSWNWRGRWMELSVEMRGDPLPLAIGSEEEFITEHYWGYTAQRDGGTLEYAVEHPRWRVWRATSSQFEGDATSLYGAEFGKYLCGTPTSTFVADGSQIVLRRGVRLPEALHTTDVVN